MKIEMKATSGHRRNLYWTNKQTFLIAWAAWSLGWAAQGQVPAISHFSPAFGPIGSTVTITGANFSTNITNNIVYVGPVRATVTSAETNLMSVIVPAGASYSPFKIFVNGLVASSSRRFTPTFPSNRIISTNSFGDWMHFEVKTNPVHLAVGDLDGDGWLDFTIVNQSMGSVSIMRNQATGNGAFGPDSFLRQDFEVGLQPKQLAIDDLDGDGKLDIAVATQTGVSLCRNISSGQTMAFETAIILSGITNVNGVVFGDVDGDGLQDVIAINSLKLSIFLRLTNELHANAFIQTDIPVGGNRIMFEDLSGDGLADLLVNGGIVLENRSTPGSVLFLSQLGIASGNGQTADIDGDGRMDIVTCDPSFIRLGLSRNLSSGATLTNGSFAALIQFDEQGRPLDVAVADFDGDAKPDLAFAIYASKYGAAVRRNTSQPGVFTSSSLAPSVVFPVTTEFAILPTIIAGDFNGDGKPDILIANSTSNIVSLLLNQMPPGIRLEASTNAGLSGDAATFSATLEGADALSYQWRLNGTNIAGATNTTYFLTDMRMSDAGTYSVLAAYDGGSVVSSNATLLVVSQPISRSVAVGDDAYFNLIPSIPGPYAYQWRFNGTNMLGATNQSLLLRDVHVGHSGNYSVAFTHAGGTLVSSNATLTVNLPTGGTNQVVSYADEWALKSAIRRGGLITFDFDGTIQLSETITVPNGITIDGAGHAVQISGGNAVRLFNVGDNTSLTLLNLTMADGHVLGSAQFPDAFGGAIENRGTLNIGHCLFSNNTVAAAASAGIAGGGAIRNFGTVIVTNSVFENNRAVGGPENSGASVATGGTAFGGAILMSEGSIFISDVAFRSNRSVGGTSPTFFGDFTGGAGYGGAITILGGILEAEFTFFEANHAAGGGGSGTASKFPSFKGGSAFGGALFITNSTVRLNNTSFVKNTSEANPGLPTAGNAAGGGISNWGNLELSDCEFITNIATGNPSSGGAIFNGGNLIAHDSKLLGNIAEGSAGKPGITSCALGWCTSGTPGTAGTAAYGGGFYNIGIANLNLCTLIENTAVGGKGGAGGNGSTNFGSAYPGGNGGDGSNGFGGAIYNAGSLGIHSSEIKTNFAIAGFGGAGGLPTGTGLNGETGSAAGGAIWNTGSLTLFDASIEHNRVNSGSIGGGVGIFSTSSFGASNSLVFSNYLTLGLPLNTNQFAPNIDAAFAVNGDNVPDTGYQWSFNSDALADVTERTYVRTNLQFTDAGIYRATFLYDYGGIAHLTLNIAPTIISQSEGGQATLFSNTTLSVLAVGVPLHFQWYLNGELVPGASNSTYTFQAIPQRMGTYHGVVSNADGSVTSAPIVLSMLPMPPVMITQPENVSVAKGAGSILSVFAAATEPVIYQWLQNGVPLPGATTATLNISNTFGANVGNYSVIISNDYGAITSSIATLKLSLPEDFNNDGRTDILFQHTDGRLAGWFMDGTNRLSSGRIFGHPNPNNIAAWQCVGLGDFDGGEAERIWRNANGVLWISSMLPDPDGHFTKNVSLDWRLAGVGDLNNDNIPDLFWQNTDGRSAVWFMNGYSLGSSTLLRNGQRIPQGWQASGLADFNNDGVSDALWHHSDGRIVIWFMQGTDITQTHQLGVLIPAASGWSIVGFNDLNDDGQSDILWQHKDNRIAVWFMLGTQITESIVLNNGRPVTSGWRVVGVR